MIKVGQLVKFNTLNGIHTTGIVKYVDTKHRWFSVEYGDPSMRMSFVFNDIDKTVTVLKG